MEITKEKIITIFTDRAKKHWKLGNVDTYVMLCKLIGEILEDKRTDYSIVEDVGLILKCEPYHHRFIEEQEDGSTKTTHSKGKKTWITYEDKKE